MKTVLKIVILSVFTLYSSNLYAEDTDLPPIVIDQIEASDVDDVDVDDVPVITTDDQVERDEDIINQEN
jgi:hypothetical protein